MSSSAKKFIRNRSRKLALTQQRVDCIFSYIYLCYQVLLSNKIEYSRSWVAKNTRDKFENYLKKRLVHDYLKKLKSQFLIASELEEILFECEPEMPYLHYDHIFGKYIESNDRIDIKVNRIGLQDIWNVEEQDIYLAIECKILSKLADNRQYLTDIRKFCDRVHLHYRLPIEGLIAFNESNKIGPVSFADDLNRRLAKCTTIKTLRTLTKDGLLSFNGNYFFSRQLRNFGSRNEFSICHLYLDYSSIIVK